MTIIPTAAWGGSAWELIPLGKKLAVTSDQATAGAEALNSSTDALATDHGSATAAEGSREACR